jgi:ankyrin repeat protein
MSDSTKAWTGLILVFAVAAGAFWLAERPINEPGVENSEFGYERPIPRRADTDPQYVRDFYQAIEGGNAKAVKDGIAKHPELITHRFGSETALHVAARCNQAQLIDLFLQLGADRKARGQWDGTALHWACWFGSKAATERLIANGLDIEDKHDVFGSSPLLWAAHGSGNNHSPKGDYSGTVMLLLAKGAAADTHNAVGVPAVEMASSEIAQILIANGAKLPTTKPSAGLTT